MKTKAFLKLIRYKNLLIIGLTQCLLKFVLLPKYSETTNLTPTQFLILVTTTIIIAAAGNIYNDILDLKADTINKESKRIINKLISKKAALAWYYTLNIVGLILGIYLCLEIDNLPLVIFFIIPVILLYLYSKRLKSTILIGNLTVSLLISLSILIVPVFEFVPIDSDEFLIIIGLSLFAFMLNLIREILKDIEDINGDLASKTKTLPVIFGRKRANRIAMVFSISLTMSLITIIILDTSDAKVLKLYLILTVIIPLLYFISKLKIAKSKKEYSFLSNLLKIIMISGILSIITI